MHCTTALYSRLLTDEEELLSRVVVDCCSQPEVGTVICMATLWQIFEKMPRVSKADLTQSNEQRVVL